MTNPWLDIPLADYEGHMALPGIEQAQLLSDVFARALDRYAPRSVAVLGCAGGNGFERISTDITERVVGVDLNPEYVEEARSRFQTRIQGLELYAGDIQTDAVSFFPVELVFAGLVFEYVDVGTVLARIHSMLNTGGVLVTIVQLPSAFAEDVSPSPFQRVHALAKLMRLVPPVVLKQSAEAHGYSAIESGIVQSTGGKRFQMQAFRLKSPNRVT